MEIVGEEDNDRLTPPSSPVAAPESPTQKNLTRSLRHEGQNTVFTIVSDPNYPHINEYGYIQELPTLLKDDSNSLKKQKIRHLFSVVLVNTYNKILQELLTNPNYRKHIDINARIRGYHGAPPLTPLDLCITLQNLDGLKLFLERKTIKVNGPDQKDISPLQHACQVNLPEFVAALCQHPKIDVNAHDAFGNTPLHDAVLVDSAEIVRTLLMVKNLDPNITNDDGNTPFHIACKITRDYHNHDVALLFAADPRVNANLLDDTGTPPIHVAAFESWPDIMELLLGRQDVDVNLKDEDGYGALDYAILEGNLDIMKQLVADPRVDVNLPHGTGDTPLLETVSHTNFDDEGNDIMIHMMRHLLGRPDIVIDDRVIQAAMQNPEKKQILDAYLHQQVPIGGRKKKPTKKTPTKNTYKKRQNTTKRHSKNKHLRHSKRRKV